MEYAPGYLEHVYQQISSISAVLGGFAVATMALLLDDDPDRSVASWAAGASGVAAGLLISTTFLASILSSDAMKHEATSFADLTPSVADLVGIVGPLFPLGMYALLLSLGLTGWIRSRGTGIATTSAAIVAAILVTFGFYTTV